MPEGWADVEVTTEQGVPELWLHVQSMVEDESIIAESKE